MRLADSFRNGLEQHPRPGEGDLDFPALFHILEVKGFTVHYMNASGFLDDVFAARTQFAARPPD